MRIQNPDAFAIEWFFEPLGWRAEYYLKINCFMLAVAMTGVFVLTSLGIMSLKGEDPVLYAPLFGIAWSALAINFMHLARIVYRSPALMNPWRPRWEIRLIVLVVSALQSTPTFLRETHVYVLALEVVYMLSLPSAFYFASCNPLPRFWEPSRVLGARKIA